MYICFIRIQINFTFIVFYKLIFGLIIYYSYYYLCSLLLANVISKRIIVGTSIKFPSSNNLSYLCPVLC